MRTRTVLIALVLAAAVPAVAAPAASAAAPCWKRLVNDWFDGRIDQTYPAGCYRTAIRNLPDDVEQYSNAREDIERALAAAVRRKGGDRNVTPTTPLPPEPAPPGGGGGDGGSGDGGTGDVDGSGDEGEGEVLGTTTDEEPGGEAIAGPGGDDGDDGVLGVFEPANADSVPIPLLVLAGLALLLLAAAAAGFVARRLQARRAGPGAAPRGTPRER